MADELYRWLDRETAERLLSGEPLEAVDGADRDQAERLAKTLESLTVEPPLTSEELPGEAAALAAFRAVRAQREDWSAAVAGSTGPHAPDASDVGLVRIGGPARAARRPRWARPVRLSLAAALAVGMVGGMAVAAGTGVLPTPFDENEPARPAATVSAPAPQRPLITPSPGTGAQDKPTPDGGPKAPTGSGAPEHVTPGGSAGDRDPDSASGERDATGGHWKAVTRYCRDLRDGKALPPDRRRTLEGAAGSSARVRTYCKAVLAGAGENARPQRGDDEGDRARDKGKGDDGQDEEKHRGTVNGKGKDRGKGTGDGKGRDRDGRRGGDEDRSRDHDGRRTEGIAQPSSTVTGRPADRTPPSPTTPI
ncbi:hypothetical protein [Streptomyces sp. NPDC093568]|uniref:hypothetical protein n=1 Tax=Streptomyces sp. NPDC093568 TaxID=3366041 RepID=UPI00381CDB73